MLRDGKARKPASQDISPYAKMIGLGAYAGSRKSNAGNAPLESLCPLRQAQFITISLGSIWWIGLLVESAEILS
jgi:hypothetical protein